MGWARGSYLGQEIWELIESYLDCNKKTRKRLANTVIDLFNNLDADDWDYESDLFRDAGYKFNEGNR